MAVGAPTLTKRVAVVDDSPGPRADSSGTGTDSGARHERVLLRQSAHFYKGISDHLVSKHGFVSFAVSKTQKNIRRTKKALLGEQLSGFLYLIRNLRRLRRARVVFAIGYVALTAKILRRFGIFRYERLYWYPFFIISTSWYPLFRWLAKLDTDREVYVVSSKGEIPLYESRMNIPRSRLTHLPFGDWESDKTWEGSGHSAEQSYYFSGGATNRDYVALAKAWQQIPDQRLVIVCSQKLNPEVDQLDFPPGVEIRKDVPFDEFESLVSGAKACILPFKHDTGGSGHSVLLQYMRKRKTIIVNSVHMIQEYITDGTSGVVIGDIATELPSAIRKLEEHPEFLANYGNAAFDFYKENFSRRVMEQRVSEMIRQ